MRVTEFELRRNSELLAPLFRVQHDAYSHEALLIGDDRIPALHETGDDLLASGLRWVGAFAADELIGAAGWTERPQHIELERLVVAPAAHRRGVGLALVTHVLAQANGRRVDVATGRDNVAARRLYEKLGFVPVADIEVLAGLWTTTYSKRP